MSSQPRRRKTPAPASSSSPSPARRPGRFSPPPPAILHAPHESLEGSAILDEMRNPAGALLWQALHDVALWASVPPARREGLFRPGAARPRLSAIVTAGVDPELEVPLTALAALVGDPVAARPEIVTRTCLRIGRWAEEQGALGTALAFAQGGAVASPRDAAAGLTTGLLARRLGEGARAEAWLRRTIVLGRRSADRLSLCRACQALGEAYAERGDDAGARALFLRALRGARRSSFREVRAQSLHALFRLEARGGRVKEADEYALAALRAHRRRHPRLAEVAREVAEYWMGRESFAEAAVALRALVSCARTEEERVAALAGLARAAACAGDEEGFAEAERRVWESLREAEAAGEHAGALLELARGAAALRRWERAEAAAQRVLEEALGREDEEGAAAAEAVLSSIWTQAGGMRWRAPAT